MDSISLEDLITRRSAAVLRCQANGDGARDSRDKALWRDEARIAAADVAWMVSLRAPETVAQMERERGLS